MFGYKIGFNINGDDYHKTCAGTLVSLFIFAWCGLVLNYLLRQMVFEQLDRPLTTIVNSNFYVD